ncbi:hypothetical protein [Mesorhizobium yinganensis]|uniref:aromatic-ring hydroxylase C-terminal domain-containing protein n=1 Tax=Mesorhizobium yinganensis TaxID=3157707 RepID=UPI003CCE3A06
MRGNVAAGILDSYQRERQPLAEQILDRSRAQVALMRPSRSAHALRTIVRDLIGTADGTTYFAKRVWGVSVRYEMDGDHLLIGRSAPDFELTDGTRLNEHLRQGPGLLLNFGQGASLQALAERYLDQISYLRCNSNNTLGLHAMFVRHDGFVAWACNSPSDVAGAARTVSQWLNTAGHVEGSWA